MALTSAIPPQTQSMVSRPSTNAFLADSSSAAEPSSCATCTPATTLPLAVAAAAAGRPATLRWVR